MMGIDFENLSDGQRVLVVVGGVVAIVGLIMFVSFSGGRASLCDNMNGTLLKNGDGLVVCVNVNDLDLCVDKDRGVARPKGLLDDINYSFLNHSFGGE